MRKKKQSLLKAAALFLALCFLFPVGVTAQTIEEMQAEQAKLEEANSQLQQKLDELKSNEDDALEYQSALSEKISVLEQNIISARKNIAELDDSIIELNDRITRAEAEVASTMEQLKERIKVLYKMGNVSSLEILLNAENLSDFSTRTEVMKALTRHDRELMEVIEKYMEDTSAERTEMQSKKEELANQKKLLEASSAELAEAQKENDALIEELHLQQASTEEIIQANEAESASLMQDIQSAIAAKKAAEEEAARQLALQQQQQQSSSNGSGSTGSSGSSGSAGSSGNSGSSGGSGSLQSGFSPVWPLPGVTYISCYYGQGGHNGLDIAGPNLTPIVAAQAGEVLVANDYDSWGDSWGYYVLIYHNGTYTTRYAHMSSMIVSKGQYVEQGQIIGYEGSTGNSTGPHLHFEVYQNGTRVNPMQFF